MLPPFLSLLLFVLDGNAARQVNPVWKNVSPFPFLLFELGASRESPVARESRIPDPGIPHHVKEA